MSRGAHCVAALATTGERFPPGFFAVFSVAAAPCAKLEQKVNFCLHAYAVHGIYVYSGIRVAAGGDFARPGPPSKNPDPSKAADALPALHRASSPDAASRRKQLTTQPVARALRGNVWWKRGLRRCARNDGGAVPPGFFCRIFGRRRARRQARTKSELLLARLRRSWHIRLQWNSCGCRRRLRPARPRPLKIQFLPKRPTPSPLFTAPAARHRRSPFSCRACSCSQRSEADAGPMQLLPSSRAKRSNPRSRGVRSRPAFFGVSSVAAEPGAGARTKSELLLVSLRRSWHIRLQWNSCGCRRRLRPTRPLTL